MKSLLLIVLVIALPTLLFAGEPTLERPHWSLEIKAGTFTPDIDGWSEYYGKKYTTEYGGSLAYKLLRQVEVGIEGTYIRDKGRGFAEIHDEFTGNVKYAVAPLNVFVLLRGSFSENQWLVPYIGGGWTRIFYREEIENQRVARGSVDGYHARGGIQLLLDGLDPDAANNMFREHGIFHTYIFFEAKYSRAMIDTVGTPSTSVNLGGTSWLGGFLFEF